MSKTLRSRGHIALRQVLTEAREKAQFSQRELSARLGRPHSYVGKIEAGERSIDPVECMAWAKSCGMDPLELFKRFVSR